MIVARSEAVLDTNGTSYRPHCTLWCESRGTATPRWMTNLGNAVVIHESGANMGGFEDTNVSRNLVEFTGFVGGNRVKQRLEWRSYSRSFEKMTSLT